MALDCDYTWQLATVWTTSHRVLINCIAAPYLSHMGYTSQDLKSEALLVAFQTLSSLLQNKKDLSLMERYFRVVFRSQCIRLSFGVDMAAGIDVEQISVVQTEENPLHYELDQDVIDAALVTLTKRQKQITEWILSQNTPASVNRISQHFGITDRGVRKHITNAIVRIENGHRKLCKTVAVVS